MTDFRTLHEDGVLKDVLDYISGKHVMNPNNFVQTAINGVEGFVKGTKNNNPSIIDRNIAKSARSLTAVFPVLVSKSVDIEKAVMVSKAIERKCVSMLHMLFASNQITSATNAKEFLRSFHKNISTSLDLSKMSIDDFLDSTEEFGMNESADYSFIQKGIQAVLEDVRMNIHYHLNTGIQNPSIADMKVSLNEARYNSRSVSTKQSDIERIDYDQYGEFDPIKQQGGKYEINIDNKPFGPNDYKQSVESLSKSIIDSDIKKANEAQPSLMIVNFTTGEMNSQQQYMNTCIIGVKAMIHYVDPQDIVNRVILKQSDKNGLFNLIRATTREISFFKDFIFAVDRAKVDAVAKSGRGSTDKIWKLLELRADRLKGSKVTRGNQATNAAITTLVISKAEVDYIKQFHRIDLAKTGTLKGILKGYNMMACAIIDEVTERVDFLWDDGTNEFESLSFASLEREEAGSMYKKVINLAMRGR